VALDTADAPAAGAGRGRFARPARRALAVAGWLLSAAILAQVLTAGLAVFARPGWWLRHRDFVHTFEWLTVVAVILAHVGRAPGAVKALAWLTVVLLFVQYATAGLRATAGREGWAATHAVGAVLLFWTATELARRAGRREPA
jgi:hypothetical protein